MARLYITSGLSHFILNGQHTNLLLSLCHVALPIKLHFCGLLIVADDFVRRPERRQQQQRRGWVALASTPLLFCRASLGYQHSGMRGMHLARHRRETEASVCCKQVVCIVNVGFAPGLHPFTPPLLTESESGG